MSLTLPNGHSLKYFGRSSVQNLFPYTTTNIDEDMITSRSNRLLHRKTMEPTETVGQKLSFSDRKIPQQKLDCQSLSCFNQARKLLTKFMELTYQELFPTEDNFEHLATTVNQYFSEDTPLWWVDNPASKTVACLWMGNAIDQINGERYSHIFLLFVHPNHRRLGIGTSLIELATNWAKNQGNNQIGIHVFADNQPALQLYQKLGFQSQSFLMLKSLTIP